MTEKTCGALFFANNNEKTNYAQIANLNAGLIKMLYPRGYNNISVVTDTATQGELDYTLFDEIIINDDVDDNKRHLRDGTVTWKNTTRTTAYDVTPYDNTLLLDVDYLQFNSLFAGFFNPYGVPINFTCVKHARNMFAQKVLYEKVGNIDMLWATAIFFTKSPEAERYFSYMEYVRQNYEYFARLYKFGNVTQYRNDFALTIANKELNIWAETEVLGHFPEMNVILHHENPDSVWFNDGRFYLCEEDRSTFSYSTQQNIHIMNKDIIFNNVEAIQDWIPG